MTIPTADPPGDLIARTVIPWRRLPWPLDWTTLFGRSAPLRAELGFGNGEFLEASALAAPEINWVGMEMSWVSVKRILKRVRSRGLTNVRILSVDGGWALEHLWAAGSLNALIANNPDPWPKKRHHDRRLVQPRFLETVARILAPGGRLTVATDHAGFGDWIAEVLEGQRRLAPVHGTTWVSELPGHYRTKYQRQGLAAGSPIRYFVWENVGDPEPAPPVPPPEIIMPNAHLRGSAPFADLFRDTPPYEETGEHKGEPVFIQLGAAYLREDGEEWWVETRVREGGFEQHLALSVRRHHEDGVLVKPSPLGLPRPTWGVRRAVRLLADRVLAAHPGLHIHASNVHPPEQAPLDRGSAV